MNSALYDYIMSLTLIDSHEFLPPREELRPRRDIISEFMSDFAATALLSAGLPAGAFALACGDGYSVNEKWELIAPYWEKARFTGGCRLIGPVIRELYGFDEINRENIGALDASFRSSFGGDRYNYIMKERCGIEYAVLSAPDADAERGALSEPLSDAVDHRFFIAANNIGALVAPLSRESVLSTGRGAGVTASAFDDYLEACARIIADFDAGSRVISCVPAGGRLPQPRNTSYSDARGAFDNLMNGQHAYRPAALYSFMLRFLLGLAAKKGMTFQLSEDARELGGAHGPGTDYHYELFSQLPELKFDILVSAIPGRRNLGVMAGQFPNVFANLCRADFALSEYLEIIPYNKIIAFGGGCRTIDAVYGRSILARENLARVLSEKTAAGLLKSIDAKNVARALTSGNAAELYGRP